MHTVRWIPNKRKARKGRKRQAKAQPAKRKSKLKSAIMTYGKTVLAAVGTQLLGRGINAILKGSGDYVLSPEGGNVNSNTLLNTGSSVPVMHSDMHGAIRISHREYLTDIFSAVSPNYFETQFVLNPADARTFPWISTIVPAFTQWKLLGCCFEFISTSGSIGSTQALGSVSFAVQYDVTRPRYRNRRELLNSFWSSSSAPNRNQMVCVECEPNLTPMAPLYLRTPALGTEPALSDVNTVYNWYGPASAPGTLVSPAVFQEQTDPRFSDHGRLEVLATGQAATNIALGELWVTYDILLIKPVLPAPGAALNTWEAPPTTIGDDTLTYNIFPEVPLAAVLPISDPDYPTSLEPVDFKS